MRAISVVAILWALASCVATSNHVVHEPARVASKPDSFARATRALTAAGLAIKSKDAAAGLITTHWLLDRSPGRPRWFRWVIAVGSRYVTVTSQCQESGANSFRRDNGRGPVANPGPARRLDCGVQPEERDAEARALAATM